MRNYEWDENIIINEITSTKEKIESGHLSKQNQQQQEALLEYLEEIAYKMYIDIIEENTIYEKVRNIDVLKSIRDNDYCLSKELPIFKRSIGLIMPSLIGLETLPSTRRKKAHISFDLALDIVGSFIKEKYPRNYDAFKKVFLDNTTSIQKGNRYDTAMTYDMIKENGNNFFVYIPNTNDIEVIRNIAHEAGHVYRLESNPYDTYDEDLLLEYESFSYEIQIIDYLIENEIFYNDAVSTRIEFLKSLEASALLLKYKDYLLSSKTMNDFTRRCHDKDLYRTTYLPNNSAILDRIDYVSSTHVFNYIYSAMLIISTLDLDTSHELYYKIINSLGLMDPNKMINRTNTLIDMEKYHNYRDESIKLLNK